MAKRKTKKVELDDCVPTADTIASDIVKPHVAEYYRDKVLDLREKGYNDNQIASMLLIHKHKIEEIK